MKYDVIVIGSGVGGLECAYILSNMGMSVLVLEQGTQIGGCIQSYYRNKATFDTGFHYVGGLDEGQSLHAAFKYMGLLNLPWHRLDEEGFDCVTIGDKSFQFAQGYDNFANRMADYFPTESTALHGYAELLRKVTQEQLDSLNPKSEAKNFASKMMEANAWRYLTETFKSQMLVNVLSGTSLKMELRKDTLPLFTFLHVNAGFIESSWRLKGDGSMIANALADGIRRNGGNVVCNAEVTELVEHNGRITHAVCSNKETYEGGVFISDIHPQNTCRLTMRCSSMKKSYCNRIARLDNTFGMFTVSLRVKPHYVKYFNCNHYIYMRPDVWTFYDKEASDVGGIMISCRVPDDGSDYIRQIDILTPTPFDNWKEWENTQVGRRGEQYKKRKAQIAEKCISLAERLMSELHCTSRIYTSTPLTWRDYTATPNGSAYGVRKDCDNPLSTMLSPHTPIPNLLLTGQSLMLHGLHGVTMTSLHTCAEVVGKEKIWNDILINQ